ncbi:hypothetical protein LINGRAHAP2_LOCUS8184, partial [Linum grandiflorum]
SQIEIALPGGEFVRHPTPFIRKHGQFRIRSSFFKRMMIDEDNLIEIEFQLDPLNQLLCSGLKLLN